MSINKVMAVGNLTRDVEVRTTSTGTPVGLFGLALNESRKRPDGTWGEVVHFVDCTLWGKRAEALAQYLVKGTKVAIEGRLNYRSWEKDGQKRSKLEVVIDNLEFLSKADAGEPYQTPMETEGMYTDADIPF